MSKKAEAAKFDSYQITLQRQEDYLSGRPQKRKEFRVDPKYERMVAEDLDMDSW